MNTPDSPTPPPSDSGVPASTPPPSAPKPAFKVTRSPFAPKLGGASGPAPISISATAGLSSVSSGPTAARAPRAAPQQARASASSKPSMAGLVIDIIAAGIAIAFAVLIALNYFSA
jgi:hypothetical protein